MPRKGKRVRLARGIYEDVSGRCIIIPVHGKPREFRYPPGEPLDELIATRLLLLTERAPSHVLDASRGSLAAAVDALERQEHHLASWKERRAELRAWVTALGPHTRLSAIKPAQVRAVLADWLTDADRPISPKTARNRLWTLKHLFRVTLGKRRATPCDDIEPPAKVRHVITPVSPERILLVYRNLLEQERRGYLRDAKTRGRFMVRASTGRRPSEIMRAQAGDIDLEQRVWRIRDGKGGWSEGLYLNDDMRAAWRVFIEADAWGAFNTGSQAEVLYAAGWPADVRPYNMRHSLGIALSERGHDLADVGGWLGHTDVRTTRSAYVPIRNSRMQRMSEGLNGRLTWGESSQERGSQHGAPTRKRQSEKG